jgi:tRNA(adenine34) deaminase
MKVFDKGFMELALAAAEQAEQAGEVPVGAVVVYEGQIIAQAFNQPILSHNPCAHAEVLALSQAGETLNNYRLKGCTLYVTLEPCSMCVSAMIHARIDRCVYGASDPKTGALGGAIDLQGIYAWNHRFEVEGGVLAQECGDILLQFFKTRRG